MHQTIKNIDDEDYRYGERTSPENNIKSIKLSASSATEKLWQYRLLHPTPYITKEEADKFPTNIADHGNSSSSSCPILLDECRRKGLFQEGDLIAMSAFGAGFVSGAVLFEW